METVILDGVTYTKASVLAKRFRYTTDYIGQLCRNNKVNCEMVGRSWYVSEASLLQHKDERYKNFSTSRDTEKTIKNINKINVVSEKVYPRISKNTLRFSSERLHVEKNVPSTIKYLPDDTSLLPQPIQINKVEVLSESHPKILPQIPNTPVTTTPESEPISLKVSIDHKPVQKLVFSDVPSVSLRGSLTVDDADVVTDVTTRSEPIVLSRTKILHTPSESLGFGAESSVVIPSSLEQKNSGRFVITVSVVTACVLSAFLIFAEEHYQITGQDAAVSLSFSIPLDF